MEKDDWGNLAAFAVIAEEHSFTRAAARLGVSPSALSHSMRGLEERLNVRLLSRSTRSVATTDAGERLLATLRPALTDISLAWEDLGRLSDHPAGHVRISATRQAARMVIGPKLPSFSAENPDVTVEVSVEPGFTDIIAARFDAGVRLGESVAKDMISVRISQDQKPAVVAARGYFRNRPVPKSPHDLKSESCIGFRLVSAGTVYKWEFEKKGQTLEVAPDGTLIFNDEDMMVDAAMAGAGIAYVFEDTVTAQLQSGQLVRVLEDWCAPIPGFYLYYPSRRQTPSALTALINALRVDEPSKHAGNR